MISDSNFFILENYIFKTNGLDMYYIFPTLFYNILKLFVKKLFTLPAL